MSAPTLDRQPGSSQSGPSAGQRRRKQLVLVVGALIVLAVAVGTSLAIASRPIDRQAAAEAGPTATATDRDATADQADQAAGSGSSADGTVPVLEDGEHPAYLTEVAGDHVVADVVQVFTDGDAVKAAVADGTSPADAKFLTTWVRNENSRLRTLPLAADLQVSLWGTCGEPGNDRDAQLARLAANAKQRGTYYYLLTVHDGKVERIQERLAVNAC
jgi:hypothetical protein